MSAPIVKPPSAGATMALGIVLPPVCAFVIALRFYARHRNKAGYRLDDWLTLPALVMLTGMGACIIVGVKEKGLGYPNPPVPPGESANTVIAHPTTVNRKVEYALELLSFPAITCVKLSFLFFYKRVFCTRSTPILKGIIWTLVGACIIWGLAFFFALVFICGTEFWAFWHNVVALKQHCYRLLDHQYWLAITDFLIDALIFLLPLPLIWRLQLSLSRKLALMAVFLLGAMAVAASITRMIIFVRAVQGLRRQYVSGGSNNLTITAGLYWTMFEVGAGLIAVCLPSCYGILIVPIVKWIGAHTSSRASKDGDWSSSYKLTPHRRTYHRHESDTDMVADMIPEDSRVAKIDSFATQDSRKSGEVLVGNGIVVTRSIAQDDERMV